MKEKIFKIIAFMIILLILLVILSRIVVPKNNTEEAGMQEERATGLLGERKNSIDMLILGDSESYTSIIPMKLWEEYGYTSYSFGTSGQSLPDSLKFLYISSKIQTPKLVALEANTIYNEMNITILMTRILQLMLPMAEYHDRWKDLTPNDFFGNIEYTYTNYMKGYYYKTDVNKAENTDYMAYTDEVEEVPKMSKLYLKIMNAYCKKIGAELMIYSSPSAKNWNYARHNGIQKFADSQQIDYIDFNILQNELNIDWNNDTLDGGDHMNYKGAVKVTDYFGHYLNSKNILVNHKNDEEYNNWNEDLIKYKETVKDSN